MNAIKSTLLISILLSFASIAKDFQILDYHNGIKTDKLPCKMEVIDNWFSTDQYMCIFTNSASDVIEFQSDFISHEVYQIDRYLLLDISDAKSITKKIFKKYGNPNSTVLNNNFSTPLPISAWGDSTIEPLYDFSHSIVLPEQNGTGLSLQFLKCTGISLGKCRSIFNITDNSPDKTVLHLSIFDAKRYAYSRAVMENGKAPESDKTIEKNTSGVNNLRL